jgi:hypothetical protein
MAGSFKAEGEIQFQYSSLKSTFQELDPEHSSSQEPASSSDDFILDTAPSNSALPKPVPELVPNAPLPDPPAHHLRQSPPPPPPPPPPHAPSSHHIKPTNRGDSSCLQKVRPPNTVPFPTDSADANTESNADPGGASANEEPDNQESANIAHGEEPKTHAQAMVSPDAAEWLAAECYELDQLARLDVYDLTLLPPGHSHTGYRWVYKIKWDTEGNIILYRACIVAQGFTQCPGEDFFETFSPVTKIKSIHLLLAIAAILDWEIHVIDVDSAFLNSTMPEDQTVYLSQPPGYVAEGKEDFVWKLGTALYSLKQSGHLWYQKLKGILEQIGFHACKSDPCIFICSSPWETSIISSHVDDLGLFCDSVVEIRLLKSQIGKHISIKDLGEIQSILGIEVICDHKACTISLSDHHYIDEIVAHFGQSQAKDVHSLMEMETCLNLANVHQHLRRLQICTW